MTARIRGVRLRRIRFEKQFAARGTSAESLVDESLAYESARRLPLGYVLLERAVRPGINVPVTIVKQRFLYIVFRDKKSLTYTEPFKKGIGF